MTDPSELPERTYRVSELGEEIKLFVGKAFAWIWVAGEIQRLKASRRGHLYFELVEKGAADDVIGKIDAVLWRNDHQQVRRRLAETDQELVEGLEIRCRGSIDFYPPGGRLQFVAREVDPLFSLGGLERRRRETLEALAEAGLLDRNRALALPRLPLTIGVITSEGSAAYHDFLVTLEESGFGFRVLLVHAAVQGTAAEREIVSALGSLGELPVDCIVLVRGGGSRSDLAAFDSRLIAEAIARSPLPVLTGVGHEIDQSVADRVAHTAMKTPTQVAAFLVERAATAEREMRAAVERLEREAGRRLRAGRDAVARAEQRIVDVDRHLRRAGERLEATVRLVSRLAAQRLRRVAGELEAIGRRLAAASPRLVSRSRRGYRRRGETLVRAGRSRLREARSRCGGHERLCRQLAPERTLARGFSITRDSDGEPVRSATGVAAGDRVRTELAEGQITSTVEARTIDVETEEGARR